MRKRYPEQRGQQVYFIAVSSQGVRINPTGNRARVLHSKKATDHLVCISTLNECYNEAIT